MNLLVTGGSGFIGSNFIIHWLTNHPDDMVTNLDLMTYAANPLTNERIQNMFGSRYSFVLGSICDKTLVDSIMNSIDVVVHFAAESHVDRSIESSHDFVNTNVIGTHVLLESAKKNKISRFHHISTDEVFGTLPLNTDFRFNEMSNYNPRSPYAATKASAEHLVMAYFYTYGIPITITNCSNNYGPYCFPEKLIPLTIIRALANKPIPIYGEGLAIRDYLHVSDHCSAIETVILRGTMGSRYCVGGDSPFNTLQTVEKILEILDKPKTLMRFTTDRPGHDMQYLTDHTKITTELGWKPQYNFEEGIAQTIDWYRNNPEWWENIVPRSEMVAEKYLTQV